MSKMATRSHLNDKMLKEYTIFSINIGLIKILYLFCGVNIKYITI